MDNKQIKTLREKLNLSQTEFAKKIGYSREHISFVENGKRPVGIKLEKKINELMKELGLLIK